MKYQYSVELTEKAKKLAVELNFDHIDLQQLACIKSAGTSTRRTIARIHGTSKALQIGMKQKPAYVIEFISEKFDRQSEEDQTRTIIHELMHIPQNFGGGFRQHDYVCQKNVDKTFNEWKKKNPLSANKMETTRPTGTNDSTNSALQPTTQKKLSFIQKWF